MRIMKYLGMNKKTAAIAKDRLHIIIAQERTEKGGTPDFLPLLRKDILAAIAKYTKVDMSLIKVDLQCKDNNSVLELNVVLPERSSVNITEVV